MKQGNPKGFLNLNNYQHHGWAVMTKVYRVEDKDGKGMYCGRVSLWGMHDPVRHPTPMDDSRLMRSFQRDTGGIGDARTEFDKFLFDEFGRVRFGFSSLDQLRRWIYDDEWKDTLYVYGFKLNVYECDRVWVGDTQAVFDTHCGHSIVKTINLIEV